MANQYSCVLFIIYHEWFPLPFPLFTGVIVTEAYHTWIDLGAPATTERLTPHFSQNEGWARNQRMSLGFIQSSSGHCACVLINKYSGPFAASRLPCPTVNPLTTHAPISILLAWFPVHCGICIHK